MKLLKNVAIVILIGIGLITFFYDPGKTEFRMNEDEVYVRFTRNTSRSELISIKKELLESKGITLDYSRSTFSGNGQLEALNLAVNCNDGYAGQLTITPIALRFWGYGFRKTNSHKGEIKFEIGRL